MHLRIADFVRLPPYFNLAHLNCKNFSAHILHRKIAFEGCSAVLITSREAARESRSSPEQKRTLTIVGVLFLCFLTERHTGRSLQYIDKRRAGVVTPYAEDIDSRKPPPLTIIAYTNCRGGSLCSTAYDINFL